MVSRSLEKMMLIAVGLSTAVIIGVPVLLYAVDTMMVTQQIQYTQRAADMIFNATQQIDNGELETITLQIYIPSGFIMTVPDNGCELIISIDTGRISPERYVTWFRNYNHQIIANAPTESGNYSFTISLVSNVIHITYSIIAG